MIPTVTLVVKGQDIYTAPVIQGGFSDLLQLTQPRKPITTDWAEEPGLDIVQTMLQPQPTRPLKTKLWLPKGLYQSDVRYIDTIRVGYDRLYPIKIRSTYVVDSYNDESVYAISGTIQQSKTPPTTPLGRNLLRDSGREAISKDKDQIATYELADLGEIVEGETYHVKVWATVEGEDNVIRLYNNYHPRFGTVTIENGVAEATFKWDNYYYRGVPRVGPFNIFRRTDFDGNTTITIHKVKLERGTVATDWTPAPEDLDDSISTLESHKQTTPPKEYTLGPEHIALATFGASPLEGWQSALQDKTTYKETSLEASRDVVLPILLQGDTFAQLLTARDTLDALLYRRTRNQLTTPYGTYSFFFTRSRVREYNITNKPYIIYDLTLTLI